MPWAQVAREAEVASGACAEFGGSAFESAASEEARRRLWAARHATYYAALGLRTGGRGLITDACVPLSRLAEVMEATARDVAASGVVGPLFGHAGDGNFHCILVVRDDDSAEYKAAVHGVNDRLIKATLAVGGTCTGEHGVGLGKVKYLRQQYGDSGGAMRAAVKRALDPLGIFNPGKVVEVQR
jgi:D-lactate dehydrogenase (cytochrome)